MPGERKPERMRTPTAEDGAREYSKACRWRHEMINEEELEVNSRIEKLAKKIQQLQDKSEEVWSCWCDQYDAHLEELESDARRYAQDPVNFRADQDEYSNFICRKNELIEEPTVRSSPIRKRKLVCQPVPIFRDSWAVSS